MLNMFLSLTTEMDEIINVISQQKLGTVKRCEVNRSILVTKICSKNTNEGVLAAHFSSSCNGGRENVVEIVQVNGRAAKVTFKDPSGIYINMLYIYLLFMQ